MKYLATTTILTLVVILSTLGVIPTYVTGEYNIFKYIALITTGALLLIILIMNYKHIKIDIKDILLLLFMDLIIVSTCFSDNIETSILGEPNRFEGLITFFIYGVIYICSKNFFRYKNINVFINIMFYVSMITGVLGIAQMYVDFEILAPIFNTRISSTFGNSNFFGSYISIILPISIAFFVFTQSKKSFILSILMFFNMISSGTRSAWVAFIAVALLGLIYLIKQKNKQYYKRTIILLICFVIIFIYLCTGFGFTKSSLTKLRKDIENVTKTGLSNEMGSNRIAIWKMTLNLIRQKPIFGCGPDNLKDGLFKYSTEEAFDYIEKNNVYIDKAHNEYLHIAATIGIPALIVYLIFLGKILIPKLKDIFKNKVSLLVTLTIISYLVQAFFNISTIGIAPLFWMILGLSDNEDVLKKLKKYIDKCNTI